MILIVKPDGTVTAVAHANDAPLLTELGDSPTWQRGGYVVPSSTWKRITFRQIRRWFGSFPKVAVWTRTWRGPWITDLTVSGGPVMGPFARRSDAIASEEEWLAERLLAENRNQDS